MAITTTRARSAAPAERRTIQPLGVAAHARDVGAGLDRKTKRLSVLVQVVQEIDGGWETAASNAGTAGREGPKDACPVWSTRLSYRFAHVWPIWLAALQNHVPDAPARPVRATWRAPPVRRPPRRRRKSCPLRLGPCSATRRSKRRDWIYSVSRYSMSARRLSSVRIRHHTSCPILDEPGRAVLNQLRSPPNRRSSARSRIQPCSRFGIEPLPDVRPGRSSARP